MLQYAIPSLPPSFETNSPRLETHLVSGLYNEKKDQHLKKTEESKLDERMDFSDAKGLIENSG